MFMSVLAENTFRCVVLKVLQPVYMITDFSNSNSKTLFDKDCSLGSVKNPSNNWSTSKELQ